MNEPVPDYWPPHEVAKIRQHFEKKIEVYKRIDEIAKEEPSYGELKLKEARILLDMNQKLLQKLNAKYPE